MYRVFCVTQNSLRSGLSNPSQASETHFGRWCFRAQHRISNDFTDYWPVFETMARPSTDNPDVLRFWMAIQNKIVICGVFVLADSAFE